MEMTLRENMLAILHGEQPEVYGDFKWATKTIMDPITISDSVPGDGQEHTDSWGTVCIKPVGAPGKHPHITPENAVVKDITKWKQQLVIPDYKQMDWTKAEEAAALLRACLTIPDSADVDAEIEKVFRKAVDAWEYSV